MVIRSNEIRLGHKEALLLPASECWVEDSDGVVLGGFESLIWQLESINAFDDLVLNDSHVLVSFGNDVQIVRLHILGDGATDGIVMNKDADFISYVGQICLNFKAKLFKTCVVSLICKLV